MPTLLAKLTTATNSTINSVRTSQGLRQSSLMVVGNSLAVGLSAIALLLISRFLGPEQFGEFSVGFALVLMLARIADLGLSTAQLKFVPTSTDHKITNQLFSSAIQYKLLACLGLALFGFVISDRLADSLQLASPRLLYASFATFAAVVLFEQLLVMLQSLHLFARSVAANACQAASKLAAATFLLAAGSLTTLAAFSSYMLAPLVPVLAARLLLPKWVRPNLTKRFPIQEKQMFNLASHAAVGFIAAGLIENIDVLLVQRYLGEYETGLFAAASRIALLVSVAGYSLANVLNPRVARYKSAQQRRAYLKKASLVLAASIGACIISIPLSYPIIALLLGTAYLPAVSTLQLLFVASFLTLGSVPFIALFFSLQNANWYFSVSGILQLVILVGANWLLIPAWGLHGAAWARIASKIVLFGFTTGVLFWYLRHEVRHSRQEPVTK